VVADGVASHVMSFYKKHGPGRFSPTELSHAWRLGALAGLVLTGAARADLCAQLMHQKEGHDVASRADFEDDVLSALNANEGRAGFFVVRVSDLSSVNQHHGREVGDEVLRLVARALREAVTPLGAVGRIRRNEFAAVLPAADFAGIKALAKKLHSTFDSPLPVLGRDDVSATIGIGIAAASGSARSVVPLFHAAYGSLERDLKSRQHKPRASRWSTR
jgi:diguanylate cyclase (GGDEF)-like protein